MGNATCFIGPSNNDSELDFQLRSRHSGDIVPTFFGIRAETADIFAIKQVCNVFTDIPQRFDQPMSSATRIDVSAGATNT